MMRFKRGDKVEVFSKEDVATGAWRCAEVISSQGDMCQVLYGLFPMIGNGEVVVERVPKEAVRPCPPPVEGEGNWVRGDLIEVLDEFSWKMARVEKVVDENTFLVRLFGLCDGFRVHKSHLRERQCWQDGKWYLIGKGLQNFGLPMGKRMPDTRTKHWSPSDKNGEILSTCMASSRTLKRRSLHYDLEEYRPVASGKKRLIETDGDRRRILSVNPSTTFEKVDAFVYPNELIGESCVHSSFNVGTAEFSRMNTWENDSCLIESSVSLGSDSTSSSVGSCSITGDDACDYPVGVSTGRSNDVDDCCSDAESSCELEYEERRYVQDGKVGLEAHRSELCRYYSVVEALYTSGPLSWEDEENLTNLRRLLHISTDEHLMVVRKLMTSSCRTLGR
ncbi:hypothetical protein Tsubulata_022827 [Turnera subulata]|uniref:ENT domain-containing protein n=1 Tax=Turnera subulata TaxID=218843 RepID=A0A9Q0G7J0_9ROSI|nr:hypothetical protein Tsubulata_022827 [Turnera subulata]